MAVSGLLVLGVFLCSSGAASGTGPHISTTPDVTFGSNVLISCNITDPPTDVKGRYWMVGDQRLDANDTASNFISYMIAKVDDKSSGEYHCIFDTVPVSRATVYVKVKPNVFAYKKFEHADEKDTAVLTCKCNSYPLITQWMWFKVVDNVPQPIVNGSEDRVFIKSDGNHTELKIHSLDIEKDRGEYICNGTNELGEGSATVSLRVRSRLAALWPFLGIVAEVLILVTIIFFHEKRTKPNEVPDDDDGGSAPLKSNAANHDKNVRQRNAN